MKYLENSGLAIRKYGEAFRFILKNNLAWFFIFPLLLHVGLAYAGFEAIKSLTENVNATFTTYSDIENADFIGAETLAWLAGGVIWLFFRLIFFFVFAYFGGYIVLIFLSPVLAVLSEKTEKIITGREFDTSPEQIVRDVIRGILIALRNMFMELVIVIGVFVVSIILGFIPVIGWAGALACQVVLFLVSSYFYGFSFIDYAVERRKLNVAESTMLMKNNSGAAIGNGLPFALSMLIPIAGSFIASFLAIVSVVAACITIVDLEKKGIAHFPVHQ